MRIPVLSMDSSKSLVVLIGLERGNIFYTLNTHDARLDKHGHNQWYGIVGYCDTISEVTDFIHSVHQARLKRAKEL